MLGKGFDGPVEAEQLPWSIILQVSLLCYCPVQRDMPHEGRTLTELPAYLPTFAYRLGHSVDLVVSGADHQRLPYGVGVCVGDGRGSIREPDLTDGSHSVQLGESSSGFRRSSSIAARYSFRVCRCT